MSVRCSPKQEIFVLSAPFPRSDERIYRNDPMGSHNAVYNAVPYVCVPSSVLYVTKRASNMYCSLGKKHPLATFGSTSHIGQSLLK